MRWQLPSALANAPWVAYSQASAAASPFGSGGREVSVPHGASDEELTASLAAQGALDARVLHIESTEGHAFGGFENAVQGAAFHRNIMNHLVRATPRIPQDHALPPRNADAHAFHHTLALAAHVRTVTRAPDRTNHDDPVQPQPPTAPYSVVARTGCAVAARRLVGHVVLYKQ